MHPPRVPLPGTVYDPLYPESDGQPMGESDPHTYAVIWLRQALKDFFARQTDVYVASQLMLYYEQGNPAGHRDPDVMVVRGVGRHQRLSFRVWEEGTLPCVVFEIASVNTWREDIGPKRELYERLGIAEYFLFAPHGRFFTPRFQGFRLEKGVYVPMTPGPRGELESSELGLRLRPVHQMVRLINASTGRRVLTRGERARIRSRRAEAERLRAAEARHEADEARQQTNEARLRADELAAELDRLRQQLAQRPQPDPPSPPS